jgi:hypothetical protein
MSRPSATSLQLRVIRLAMAAVALLGLAGTLASCGGSGAGSEQAERVAVRWLQAMQASDVKLACQLMDARNHAPHTEYPSWSPARNCQEVWLHSDNTPLSWKPKPNTISIWGEDHPKVLGVDVEGNRATVFVDGVGGNERPIWLRKERGHWLVDGASYPI